MASYLVYFHTGASVAIRVEADSEDEASEKAADSLPRLCSYCAGYNQSGIGIGLGDWDFEEAVVEDGNI